MRRAAMLLVVLLVCPSVFATVLVGPSTTMLDEDRFGLSVEYSRTEADLTFDLDPGRATEDFDFDTTYALFSAAATRWWELFIRLGAAQAETTGFDGDMNFSWGLGTRLTVLDWNDFTWGAMVQFTNVISRFDTTAEFIVGGTPTLLETEEELDIVEYNFATGPTWRHGPLAVYGGLLLRYVTGELDFDAGFIGDQLDIDRQWDAGGYIGATVAPCKARSSSWLSGCQLVGEGRFTGDSTGFSVALLLPFGGEP